VGGIVRGGTIALGVATILAAGGVAIARIAPPWTTCSVSEAQYRALKTGIAYDQAKAHLGCEGMLVELGGPHLGDVYAWRSTAWPYGSVTAHFFRGALKSKSMTSIGPHWR
jgi:hypothetical protein